MLSNAAMALNRPWNWWFDEKAGGGMLGAIGSHQSDLVRWLLDTEFSRVQGTVKNFLPPQPDAKTQVLKPVTTDNYAQFFGELENGAVGSILLDATARQTQGWRNRVEFHGDKGSLIYDEDGKLWALDADGKEEQTPPDPLRGTIDAPGMFPEAFVHYSRALVNALHQNTPFEGAATFEDGVKIQAILDAVRRSSQQGGWVEPASL
jgi:predicted dehydrogenase